MSNHFIHFVRDCAHLCAREEKKSCCDFHVARAMKKRRRKPSPNDSSRICCSCSAISRFQSNISTAELCYSGRNADTYENYIHFRIISGNSGPANEIIVRVGQSQTKRRNFFTENAARSSFSSIPFRNSQSKSGRADRRR